MLQWYVVSGYSKSYLQVSQQTIRLVSQIINFVAYLNYFEKARKLLAERRNFTVNDQIKTSIGEAESWKTTGQIKETRVREKFLICSLQRTNYQVVTFLDNCTIDDSFELSCDTN